MHRKKSFVILALVTIALLVYFFSRANSKKKTGNIASVYEDKIDKILIENQQVTITLIKKTAKGDWRLQENNFPVSPTRLASLLQYFNFAEIKSLVARKEENHPKYSVADTNNQTRKEEHGQRVKIFQKDKRVLDLILGRVAYSPERVRFIRFAGENEVYSSSIGSLPDLDLEKVMQSGTPQEVYQNPKNLFVAQFLGSPPINSFFAKVKGTELIGDFGRINLKNLGIKTDPQKIPEKIVFAIRPHDLKTSNSQNKGFLKAKLLSSEYLGAETYHYFQAGKQKIMLAIPQQNFSNIQKGADYNLDISMKKIFFFNNTEEGENITSSIL